MNVALHLAKAGRHLRAVTMLLDAALPEPAWRSARMASYHATQALIGGEARRPLVDDAVASEMDLHAAKDAARLATGLVRAILPVMVQRDPASAATAEAVRRELDLLDIAAA